MDVHQASTVAHWTFADDAAPLPPQFAPLLDPANLPDTSKGLPVAPPQNIDPGYVKDLLKAIQSQSVNDNPALSSLA